MEVKELRIGNRVQRHELTPIETISVITELSIETDFTNLLGIEHFKPILLTEEWLLKFDVLFGFNHYVFEYAFDCYCLRLPYGLGMSKFISEIKYVHQLQNLYFALTNTELELKDK